MHTIPHCHPAVLSAAAQSGTASPGSVPPDQSKPILAKITEVLMLWIALGLLLAIAAPKSSLSGEFFVGKGGATAAKLPPS